MREQNGAKRGLPKAYTYKLHTITAYLYTFYSCNEHMFYVHIEHDEYTIIVAAYYAHIFMDIARFDLCPQRPMQQEQQP